MNDICHEEIRERLARIKAKGSRFMVWYGFRKMTEKAVTKRELMAIFENCDSRNDRKMTHVGRHYIFASRRQSDEEMLSGLYQNRQFTTFSMLIDQKPFFGDIDMVLDANFQADSNHSPEHERMAIRKALRAGFFQTFGSGTKQNKHVRKIQIL